MKNFTLEDAKKLFKAAAAAVAAKEVEFSKLDAATGDGDHGTAIKAAIAAAAESFENSSDLKNAFYDAGFATMSATSGSTSTLYGALLMGIGDGIEDGAQALDAAALAKAFASGLANVRAQTKAAVGDKTLMDALIPAVEAMKGAVNVQALFDSAAAASKKGAESTFDLQAKFGRARNLAEKSIGTLDAGATSNAHIFAVFADTFKNS